MGRACCTLPSAGQPTTTSCNRAAEHRHASRHGVLSWLGHRRAGHGADQRSGALAAGTSYPQHSSSTTHAVPSPTVHLPRRVDAPTFSRGSLRILQRWADWCTCRGKALGARTDTIARTCQSTASYDDAQRRPQFQSPRRAGRSREACVESAGCCGAGGSPGAGWPIRHVLSGRWLQRRLH